MVYQAHLKTIFETLLTPWTQRTGEFQSAPPDGDITTGTKSYLVPKVAVFIIKHVAVISQSPHLQGQAHVTSKVFSLVLEGRPEEGEKESAGCLGFLSAPTVSKVKGADRRRKFTVTQHMTSEDGQTRSHAWTHRESDRLQFV